MKDGAHTHGHGGGELGGLAVIVAAVLAAEAFAAVIWWLLAVTVLLIAATAAVGVGFHRSARRAEAAFAEQLAARRDVRPLDAPRRRELPAAVHQHVHFHGLNADDIGELLRRGDGGEGC